MSSEQRWNCVIGAKEKSYTPGKMQQEFNIRAYKISPHTSAHRPTLFVEMTNGYSWITS